MDSFIFIDKGPVKKKYTNEVMALLCLECVDGTDPDDLDEHSKIDYETLVSQHKDSLYYSESDEEEIVEEGRAKICHQKENLEFLHKLQLQNNDHVRDDVEDIEVPELLQFQVHHWHPLMQANHFENTENHSRKDKSVIKKKA